jgi:uncharacterized membrane protein YbhN (UPF0104 family)
VLAAELREPPPWDGAVLLRLTAFLALAYVAGFVIVIVPSGLGVREYFLTLFLVPEVTPLVAGDEAEGRALAILAVLVLRLVWTAAELVITGVVYWLPGQRT